MRPVEEIKEILRQSLKELRGSGMDQGSVICWESELDTVRTYLNRVGPSSSSRDEELYVSAFAGKKFGQAHTTSLSGGGIRHAVRQASEKALHSTPLSFFPSLPGPFPEDPPLRKRTFYDSTVQVTPGQKTDCIRRIMEATRRFGLQCSVKLMTGGGRIGIINTGGTLKVMEFSEVSLSLILTGDHSRVSAYASGSLENFEEFDPEAVVQEAVRNANLQKLKPREDLYFSGKEKYFDVILEPYAVAEWIEMLASIGFNGLLYEEGESFISGKLNQKVLGENINLYDDGSDPAGLLTPFDFEGVPKSKKVLFEKGVARSVCYDSFLAEKYGKITTGHALPPFDRSYGAVPRNLYLEGGNSTLQEMVASSENSTLYITRFHYTNVANSREGLLTGMTKDGTFLIEKGKFKGPVFNLRYLENIPEALGRVTHLGRPRLVHDPVGYGSLYPESTVVPPLKIEKVRFIGSSGH